MKPLYVILTQPNCVWCDRAKHLLRDHGLNFTAINVAESVDLKMFLELSGLKTVPQVYRNGHRVGGFDDLLAQLGTPNAQPSFI